MTIKLQLTQEAVQGKGSLLNHFETTSIWVWYGKEGETHNYTLFDPDANC
jgi:hypothetical protein